MGAAQLLHAAAVSTGQLREAAARGDGSRAGKAGTVFVRSSEIWRPELTPVAGQNKVYTTPTPDDAFFGDFPNPFKRKRNAGSSDKNEPARPADGPLLSYSLGQIFCDGRKLRQSRTVAEVDRVPGSWILSPNGKNILLHLLHESGGNLRGYIGKQPGGGGMFIYPAGKAVVIAPVIGCGGIVGEWHRRENACNRRGVWDNS